MTRSSLRIPCSRTIKTASYEYIHDRQNDDSTTKNEKFDEPAQWPNDRTRERVWLCRAHQRPFPYDAWPACPCTSATAPPSSPAPLRLGMSQRCDWNESSWSRTRKGCERSAGLRLCQTVWYPPMSRRCEFGGGERLVHGANHPGVVEVELKSCTQFRMKEQCGKCLIAR